VEKALLTSREGSIDAGFNNLPNLKAKFNVLKINDLQTHL
jgi:hypothetical protein